MIGRCHRRSDQWGSAVSPLGGSMLANKNFLFVNHSSPDFFHGTRKESLSIIFLSHFWISKVVPEIFAIKVESCQKSRWISDVFSPSQISGGRPSKNYTHLMTPASRHVVWKMFCEDTPTSPEFIVANTLNYKPNFKFSRSKVFGRTHVPFGCALSRLG